MRYCIINTNTGKPASGMTNNLSSLRRRMDRIRAGGLYDHYGIFSYRVKSGKFMGAKLELTARKPYQARGRIL